MRTGRIETYIHSDSTTQNKGAAVVTVLSQTDFAAKTDEFITFAKSAAKLAFAANTTEWAEVIEAFPHIEEERVALTKELRETILVEIVLVKL
jgi:translation elongation factor EF-Ts